MIDDQENIELTDIERERLLFILGAYAYSEPTAEWIALVHNLEYFVLEVATRLYTEGKHLGTQVADASVVTRNAAKPTEKPGKRNMPEWEA